MSRYHVIACHVLWREICYFAAQSNNVFDFTFLEQGLHNTPDILRERLQQAIDSVSGQCDAILVGYGLCSNGLEGIIAGKTRVVLVKAHDCITFLLGSKVRYREYFDKNPGTYWYSPGWIDTGTQPGRARYEGLLREYIEKYGEDNAAYLMETEQGWFQKYSTAAYIDLGFMDGSSYREYAKECSDWLGWNYDELEGDSRLIVDLLNNKWNDEDFLVLEPGQKVVASHDERIITAV